MPTGIDGTRADGPSDRPTDREITEALIALRQRSALGYLYAMIWDNPERGWAIACCEGAPPLADYRAPVGSSLAGAAAELFEALPVDYQGQPSEHWV